MAKNQGDFKRPNHSDFKTSSELAKEEFTGLRHNSITDEMELWIYGNIELHASKEDIKKNPKAVQEAYERFFQLHEGTAQFLDPSEFLHKGELQ